MVEGGNKATGYVQRPELPEEPGLLRRGGGDRQRERGDGGGDEHASVLHGLQYGKVRGQMWRENRGVGGRKERTSGELSQVCERAA